MNNNCLNKILINYTIYNLKTNIIEINIFLFLGMLMNETGKIEGSFSKVGQFFNSCLEFEEKPVDFAPGKYT